MPNTKSAKKRTRQIAKRRLQNRYKVVATRNAIKKLLAVKEPKAATELMPKVESMLDRLSKHGIIHRNNAANHKSRLRTFVNRLAAPAAPAKAKA